MSDGFGNGQCAPAVDVNPDADDATAVCPGTTDAELGNVFAIMFMVAVRARTTFVVRLRLLHFGSFLTSGDFA